MRNDRCGKRWILSIFERAQSLVRKADPRGALAKDVRPHYHVDRGMVSADSVRGMRRVAHDIGFGARLGRTWLAVDIGQLAGSEAFTDRSETNGAPARSAHRYLDANGSLHDREETGRGLAFSETTSLSSGTGRAAARPMHRFRLGERRNIARDRARLDLHRLPI
jgi:hypothetical protein